MKVPIRDADEVFSIAMKLMRELYIVTYTQNEPIRLIGLRLSRLCNDVTRSKPITSFISPRASVGEPGDSFTESRGNGIELKNLVCPHCSGKFEISETMMNFHIQTCGGPAAKRKRSLPKTTKKRQKRFKRLEDYYNL